MFHFSTQSEEVKRTAHDLISKRDFKHVKTIVEIDDSLNTEAERDIQARLEKWRIKERKKDFHEKIT